MSSLEENFVLNGNFITSPHWNKEKEELGGGQVPGARFDGTTNHHSDMGQGAGWRRVGGEGHVPRAAGRPGFGMNPPHTQPPTRRAAVLETREERSRTQWPSNAHQQHGGGVRAPANTQWLLCFQHKQTSRHSWRGGIRSASVVKQVGCIRSRALNTNYSQQNAFISKEGKGQSKAGPPIT